MTEIELSIEPDATIVKALARLYERNGDKKA